MVSAPTLSRSASQLLPRVDHRPDGIAYSYGPAACELAELAGWGLDAWQAAELDLILSVHEDGLWACRDYDLTVARQQGKTARVAAPRALAGLLLLGEEELFWSAHEVKTVLDSHRAMTFAFRRLGERINDTTVLLDGGDDGEIFVKITNNNGFEGFELTRPNLPPNSIFPPAQRLRFIARSKGSGRGMSGDCNINDEAFAMNDEQTDALAPTQLARPNPQDLYFSSPPLDGRSGAVLFDLQERAVKGDPRLGFRDYGLARTLDALEKMSAEDIAAFLDDRDNWYAALPALAAGRVPERSIEAMRRKMKDRGFAREILGMWPLRVAAASGAWQILAETDWLARGGGARNAWTDEVAFAIAAPPEQDWAAIDIAGKSRDGEILVQVVRYERGTTWVIGEAVELAGRNPGVAFAVDPHGPAGHLITPLQDAGIRVVEPSTLDVDHADQRFVRGIVDEPEIRHFGQPAFGIAVKAAAWKDKGDVRRFMRRGGTDISPLDAASLAVWALGSASRGRSAYEDNDLMVV